MAISILPDEQKDMARIAELGVDVITEDVAEQIESIVLQVAAVVGFTLAGANTPKKDEPVDDYEDESEAL